MFHNQKVQDIVAQLHRFITSMSKFHSDCFDTMKSIMNIFPIEVDLPDNMLSTSQQNDGEKEDDDEDENDDDDDDSECEDAVENNSKTDNSSSLIDIGN